MKSQRGFGAIAAIVILVLLAGLAGALVSLGTTQQLTSAQDVLSARAALAARAGNEWGLHRALKGDWNACAGVTESLDLTADSGFWVTTTCDSWTYNEGESVPGTARRVRVYRIHAVACPRAPCPATDAATVAAPAYVERTRTVIAAD